ncbi:MAG: extracellular solute-binding protein, partial [Anaerolineales bacterium]|nr:extracellular solute-binding protein [Anaerolineales bacterium]
LQKQRYTILNKIFYILFVLVFVLSACQSASDEPVEGEPAPVEEAAPVVEEEEAAPAEEEMESVTLQIVGPWLASEADAFEAVLDGFRESTGIEVVYEGVDDVIVPLTTRIAAGSPPDLAILPVANGLKDFAGQGALISLNDLESEITANFASGWVEQLTIDGNIYAIPTRANVANLLWYNPATLEGDVPTSWTEFLAFCDEVVANGGNCTAGIANTTFTLSILFEDVYLSTYGVDQYNSLMSGETAWTDASVVEAMNRIATFYGDDYTAGGSSGALGTGLVDGIARVFGENADATFVAGGSWVGGIVSNAINENLVEGETIDYVLFPGEEAGEGAIVAAADVAVMLVDSPEGRELLKYLMSAEGQALFAPNGFTVANMSVDPALFTGLTAKSAELLANSAVAPSSGVVLSNETRTQLIEVIGAVILDPDSIESLLETMP